MEKLTYKAMQVAENGLLEAVCKPIPAISPNQVLLEVEACGVCGADLSDIKNNLTTKRVIGHEIIGRIIAKGESVASRWGIGQRVGVGRLGGHCNQCDACRAGQFVHCEHQSYVGSSRDGGFAELMVADETGLVAVPSELEPLTSAPLLCAGLATFNALRNSRTKAGDTVAILGVGGLGHLAVQYAHKMGFRVIAIGRKDLQAEMTALGAFHYVKVEDAVAYLKLRGGADLLVSTIGDGKTIADIAQGLAPRGKVLLLGASGEPLALPLNRLVGREQQVQGSLTGTPFEAERTLQFSVLTGVRPQVEIFPLEQAQQAIERLQSGKAKFRIVLDVKGKK